MYLVTLSQHEKTIIQKALEALRFTPFCAEEPHNEFDTYTLEGLLHGEVTVKIDKSKFKNSAAVDFPPEYEKQKAHDASNCRLYAVRYTEQTEFKIHSLGFFTDENGFSDENQDLIYALKLSERVDFDMEDATVIRIR